MKKREEGEEALPHIEYSHITNLFTGLLMKSLKGLSVHTGIVISIQSIIRITLIYPCLPPPQSHYAITSVSVAGRPKMLFIFILSHLNNHINTGRRAQAWNRQRWNLLLCSNETLLYDRCGVMVLVFILLFTACNTATPGLLQFYNEQLY